MALWNKTNKKPVETPNPDAMIAANTASVTVTAINGDWVKTTTYDAVGGTRTKTEILVGGNTIVGA